MPERPMHAAATAGQRISIMVQPCFSEMERFTLDVDTHSYVGTLRQRIAAKCGRDIDPASLRLLCMGGTSVFVNDETQQTLQV